MSNLTVIYDSAYRWARKEKKLSVREAEIYADNQVKQHEADEVERMVKKLEGESK